MNTNKVSPITEILKFSLLNIDKPRECTSFDVANKVKNLLNIKKTGHLGTLDPNVTGVLPICLDNACKIQEYFMHQDKTYIGKMKLHKKIAKKELEQGMSKFIGKINQLPPRISRVKRVIREREIKIFKLLSYNEETREAEFIAEVQAGTYIRKLIDDLGKSLDIGAQMIELRRTKAGLFSVEDKEFTTLGKLEEAVKEYKQGNDSSLRELLIPAEIITRLLNSIEVLSEYEKKLRNGSPLFEEMFKDKKLAKEIIRADFPFCVIIEKKLIEIAKQNEMKSKDFPNILAWPEVVLN